MTGSPRGAGRAGRSRDAAASKDALLQAAQSLFGQQGFEGTTIREIGERAGVDAALIARYFGSKADLYIAAVAGRGRRSGTPREYEGLEQMADVVVTRADQRGPGPDPSGHRPFRHLRRDPRRRPEPPGPAPGRPPGRQHDSAGRRPPPAAGAGRGLRAGRHQPRALTGMVRGDPIGAPRRPRRPHRRRPRRDHRERSRTLVAGRLGPAAARRRRYCGPVGRARTPARALTEAHPAVADSVHAGSE